MPFGYNADIDSSECAGCKELRTRVEKLEQKAIELMQRTVGLVKLGGGFFDD